MKSGDGFYRLIYEYYEARIRCGFYVCGDRLPSIQKICGIFRMAPATVRAGLRILEKNGYIKMDARKAALVVYKAESADFRRNAAAYFVPRREGIRDLIQAQRLLIEPLLQAGMRRLSRAEWEVLLQGLSDPGPGSVSMPVQLYILALKALNNGLIINCYWEVIRYIRYPYLTNREERQRPALNLPGTSRDEIIDLLQRELERITAVAAGQLYAFMEQAAAEYHMENVKPVHFQCNIYSRRPQLRYTLASRLIREMLDQTYPAGSYLPSLPQLAGTYGVGVNTVRRTLELLSRLGLVRSRHGKGTLVCEQPGEMDLESPEIRDGFRLYRESLQFLALTIRPVARCALESAAPEAAAELKRRLSCLKGEERCLCLERILDFIVVQCPSMFVRECYGMVRQLAAWGYPLELQRRKNGAGSGAGGGLHNSLDNGPGPGRGSDPGPGRGPGAGNGSDPGAGSVPGPDGVPSPAKLLAQCLEEGSAEGFAEECERFLRQEEVRCIR